MLGLNEGMVVILKYFIIAKLSKLISVVVNSFIACMGLLVIATLQCHLHEDTTAMLDFGTTAINKENLQQLIKFLKQYIVLPVEYQISNIFSNLVAKFVLSHNTDIADTFVPSLVYIIKYHYLSLIINTISTYPDCY